MEFTNETSQAAVDGDELKIDDKTSLARTPDNERMSSPIDMFFGLGGVNLAVTNLGAGALGIVLGLSVIDVIMVYLFGGAIGALFIGLCVVQAKRTGSSVMINARPAFGYYGARILTIMAFTMTACWFGVNNYFGVTSARSIVARMGVPPSKIVDITLLLTVMSLLVVIAIFGYKWIIRYQRFTVFAMGAAVVVIGIGAISSGSIDWTAPGSANGVDRLVAITTLVTALGVGWAVSWTPYSYDFGRYLLKGASESAAFFFGWLGMFLVGGFTFSLSAAIASFAGTGFDVGKTVEAVLPDGLALVVLTVLLVGLLPANLANLLVGPALLATMDLRLKRNVAVLVTAIAGLPIAIGGIISPSFAHLFEGWMLSLAVWLGPWLVITLVDFYFISNGHYSNSELMSDGTDSRVLWFTPGVASFVLGVIGALTFASTPLFESPLMANYFAGADISLFAGMLVAGCIYVPWARRLKLANGVRGSARQNNTKQV